MSGMPAGMMSPEMMKMAADMMKNMDPEEMMRMQQMATSMGGPGAGMTGERENCVSNLLGIVYHLTRDNTTTL
jgi:hypothetical protein